MQVFLLPIVRNQTIFQNRVLRFLFLQYSALCLFLYHRLLSPYHQRLYFLLFWGAPIYILLFYQGLFFWDQYQNYEKYSEVIFDEQKGIPKFWDELGVTDAYKITFVNIVIELDISIRKDYFEYELKNLTDFSDLLKVHN